MLFAAASATPAEAAVRHVWVAAVPTTWNIVPNGRDGIMGTTFEPAQTVFPTVVYRRFTSAGAGRCATRPRPASTTT